MLTDKDVQTITEYSSKGDLVGFSRFFYNLDCYNTVFKSLKHRSSIEAFSSKSGLVLASVGTSNFVKNSIINDRMDYFRLMKLNDDNKLYDELMHSLDEKDIPNSK